MRHLPAPVVVLSAALLLTACPDAAPGDDADELGTGTEVAGSESDLGSETVGSSSSSSSSETVGSSTTDTAGTTDTGTGTTDTDTTGDTGALCHYPAGAVEPMALDEVLTPYAWPEAIHADGTTVALDLIHAPCDTDPVIDWSIHELLVFISVPAW